MAGPTLYVSNPAPGKTKGRPGAHVAKKTKKKAHHSGTRKASRSPAQKAATRRMIAANKGKAAPARRRRRRAPAATAAPRRARRSAPAATRSNPSRRRRAPRRTSRRGRAAGGRARRSYGRSRRRGGVTIRRSNPIGKIPILGTAIALIPMALYGLIGVEGIGQMHRLASKAGLELPEMMLPFTYTIGGLLLAGVVQLLTFIPAPVRMGLSVSAASAGAGVDWYRYREAQGAYGALEMGDAGEWEVLVDKGNEKGELGALELGDFGALELGGDDDMGALDFSMAEGQTLADEGYGAFHRRFVKPLKRRVHEPAARRQAEGARWLWLAKKVSPEGLERLAKLSPNERLHFIASAKKAVAQGVEIKVPKPQLRLAEGIRHNQFPGQFARPDWSHGYGPGEFVG